MCILITGPSLLIGFTITTTSTVFYAARSKEVVSDAISLPDETSNASRSEEFESHDIEFGTVFLHPELLIQFKHYLTLEFCLENMLVFCD